MSTYPKLIQKYMYMTALAQAYLGLPHSEDVGIFVALQYLKPRINKAHHTTKTFTFSVQLLLMVEKLNT